MRDLKFRYVFKNKMHDTFQLYLFRMDEIECDGFRNCLPQDIMMFDFIDRNQCTGLRDKNDKMIYEGDIVTIDNKKTGWIVWGGIWDYAGFVVETERPEPPNTDNKTSDFLNPELSVCIQVMGNIYEDEEYLRINK